MHFYKAKWEASAPTKVQVNVATNTDFMVGTELYVKGEKKEIAAENVKLIDTAKYPVQYSFTTASSDLADYAIASNKNVWTLKQPILLKSNLKSSDSFTTCSVVDDGTVLNATKGDGNPFVSASASNMLAVANIYNESSTEICRLYLVNLGRIADGVPGNLYYALYSYLKNDFVSEFEIPAGAKFQSTTFWDPATGNTYNRFETWIYEYKTSDVLEPDTSVNGIPAFTMKSLDAEADKLYDVEFKSEQDDVNVALSASSPMFNFLSATSSGYVYEAAQDFTIEAPVYQVGSEYAAADKPTSLKAFKTTGENWLDGNCSDPLSLVEVVVDGATYAIMPTNKATFDYLGLANKGNSYFYISNASTYKWMEKVTVPAGTQVKFAGDQKLDGSLVLRVARMLMGEAYDCKFKLSINEDEQAYGDVQVGQEFENTITLSGTYDDDTAFSYTIPVVEG